MKGAEREQIPVPFRNSIETLMIHGAPGDMLVLAALGPFTGAGFATRSYPVYQIGHTTILLRDRRGLSVGLAIRLHANQSREERCLICGKQLASFQRLG